MPRVLESKHMITQVKFQEHLHGCLQFGCHKISLSTLTLKVPRVTNISFLLTISMVVAKTKTRNADPETKASPPQLFFLFYFIRTPIRRRYNGALYFLIIANICPLLPYCPHSIHH